MGSLDPLYPYSELFPTVFRAAFSQEGMTRVAVCISTKLEKSLEFQETLS